MRRRFLLIGYLVLLVLSNGYRWYQTHHDEPPAADPQLLFTDVALDDQAVRVAYREYGDPEAPVVIALHGSPSAQGFAGVGPQLATHFRVIAPHMPGFGASTARIDDYSIVAHARYLEQLMNTLAIERAHLVGYSMGGGVSLAFYDLAPARVRSLTMLSAIGVQELEMFGHYHLNHAVHGLQLAFLKLIELGLPHFGLLDRGMLNSRYARNFFDTDQRPLRELLTSFEPPMLVLHGKTDALVPVAAATEHQRIVPHSELVELDGGHGLVFTSPNTVAKPLLAFLLQVENGTAPRRAQATPARITRAQEPLSDHIQVRLTGIALILALITLALSTLISEDATCIAAGFLVAGGVLAFWPAAIACLLGIYFGDGLLFYLGRQLGGNAIQRAPLRWFISHNGIDTAKAWFAQRGPLAILISRFVPGTRFPTYVAAGALGLSFLRFSGWFLLAAILWTPALVGLSAALGQSILGYFEQFASVALPALLGLIAALVVVLRIVLPMTNHRGRRLLLGRWRRLTRWEFWPRWAFYPPLVLYILLLGIRYRSLTLFTAANPAMPDGGFVGEPKADILHALTQHDPTHIATTQQLPDTAQSQRRAAVDAFMARHDLTWPVVLKPNVGERGSDVVIAYKDSDVDDYLAAHQRDTLVQAFAPGHEFGVFYVRQPNAAAGSIFAITDKRPPSVTGDGIRTLETLILDDDRAVCMAPTYLDRHADKLFYVPASGANVQLVDIGTHSRGCVFLDGEWVRTAALEEAIDQLSLGYDGFYFGRYDIRTPDVEAFKQGRNFVVVELNGVTSEATNIYDPANSLFSAYRTLAKQWRLAFEIGARNRVAGAPVTPALTLLRRVFTGV